MFAPFSTRTQRPLDQGAAEEAAGDAGAGQERWQVYCAGEEAHPQGLDVAADSRYILSIFSDI